MDEAHSVIEELKERLAAVEAERDYFRLVAGRLGRKSLADTQDFARLITHLRQTKEELRRNSMELEKTVEDRTAELVASVRELRTSTSRYDQLVRLIPVGVYTLRFDRDGAMRFEYVSPRLCNMLSLDPDAVLKDPTVVFAAAAPEDRSDLERTSKEATRQLVPFRWEGRFLVREEILWVRIEADPVATPDGGTVWNGVVSDITERKLVQERLRESEELYRLLTEVSPSAIAVVDPCGAILMANPKALELFRLDEGSEVAGKPIDQWVAPECLEKAVSVFRELFRKGVVSDLELTFVRNDGSDFVGEVNATLLRDSHDHPKLIVIVLSDMTQKKHAEGERLKLQKLEAIGTLAGGIAHDFNNLLQGVFGYVSLARLKLHDRDEAGEMLAQAEQAMEQAVGLTSQLLTFAKGGMPLKKNVALRPIIENAARLALSGSCSRCDIDTAEDLWLAHADGGQIGQVVQNLVLNASQAMNGAGRVEVRVDNHESRLDSDHLATLGDRFVRIRIKDSGTGIPQEYLSKIFDPYFTTKEKGSGLGLATSFSIIKRHGGLIRVHSEPGNGSIFWIYLPAVADEPDGETRPAGTQAASPRKALVLVMDDEEVVRDVAGQMVVAAGFDLALAADGEEALVMIRNGLASGCPIDIVILDLTVKEGMGGEEAVVKIRELQPDIKAVVSSGYSENTVVARYREYGFDACLNKPYTLAGLRRTLSDLLAP